MNPLVNVIIPCYGQGHLLSDAVGSLFAQTYPSWQAVLVNDGSPDNTQKVAARLIERDPERLIYVDRANGGLPAARNTGIAVAKGEYLLFLDADDLITSDFLARHVEVIDKNDVDITCCGAIDTSLDGDLLAERPVPDFYPDPLTRLLNGNVAVVHSFVVKREAVINVGGFDEQLKALEDWDLWLRLAAYGCRFASIDFKGAVYRRHPNGMAADFRRMFRNRIIVSRKWRMLVQSDGHSIVLHSGMQRIRQWYLRRLLKTQLLAGMSRLPADCLFDPGLMFALLRILVKRR